MTRFGDHYVTLDDGTVWPVNVGPLEWRLRYGQPSRSDLLMVASVLAVYGQLVDPHERQGHAETKLRRARLAQREAREIEE